MSWKKLLANKNVVTEPPSKAELDNLRSIVDRSMKDVAAPGLWIKIRPRDRKESGDPP